MTMMNIIIFIWIFGLKCEICTLHHHPHPHHLSVPLAPPAAKLGEVGVGQVGFLPRQDSLTCKCHMTMITMRMTTMKIWMGMRMRVLTMRMMNINITHHDDHHSHLKTIEDNNSKLEDILDSVDLDWRYCFDSDSDKHFLVVFLRKKVSTINISVNLDFKWMCENQNKYSVIWQCLNRNNHIIKRTVDHQTNNHDNHDLIIFIWMTIFVIKIIK